MTALKTMQLALLVLSAMSSSCLGFVVTPSKKAGKSGLSMMPVAHCDAPQVADIATPFSEQIIAGSSSTLNSGLGSTSSVNAGIKSYLSASSSTSSSSMTVALQERKIPTAEEIAAKKRNFNLIFWGGGFVAPFAATVFYFGFKFWEK